MNRVVITQEVAESIEQLLNMANLKPTDRMLASAVINCLRTAPKIHAAPETAERVIGQDDLYHYQKIYHRAKWTKHQELGISRSVEMSSPEHLAGLEAVISALRTARTPEQDESEDEDEEPVHQVGWLDPKDPTRIQATTHYMIRELGNPENWIPLYAPNKGGAKNPEPVADRHMVSREVIKKTFGSVMYAEWDGNWGASDEAEFARALDAIYALQLSAPQPVSTGEVGPWVNDPLEVPTEDQKSFWNDCTEGQRKIIIEMTKRGRSLRASRPPVPSVVEVPSECGWSRDEWSETWSAGCGAEWVFPDGGPVENDMKFCPSCGKPVILSRQGVKGTWKSADSQKPGHIVAGVPFDKQ